MIVQWKLDDTKTRSGKCQTEIKDSDLSACKSDYERDVLIEKRIQADFQQNISWYRI